MKNNAMVSRRCLRFGTRFFPGFAVFAVILTALIFCLPACGSKNKKYKYFPVSPATGTGTSTDTGTGTSTGTDTGTGTGTGTGTTPEQFITDMVAQVSQSDMQQFLEDLVAMSPRPSNTLAGEAAAVFIYQTFTGLGAADVQYQDVTDGPTDPISPNVIVTFTGSVRPGEIYVSGAHYDSHANSPGADDNGSGMAALVEMVRIFTQYDFEATIMVVAFSGEELGCEGSGDFVTDAVANAFDIRGMINIDMIGYLAPGDTEDVDIIYDPAYNDGLTDASIAAQQNYVPGFGVKTFVDPGGFDSDQIRFWNAGYPAVFYHEDVEAPRNPTYHQPTDTVAIGINSFSLMADTTKTALATIATLAVPVDGP